MQKKTYYKSSSIVLLNYEYCNNNHRSAYRFKL
jgi:hypothetical protein